MTKWDKSNENTKTWKNYQKFFEEAYIACKRYNGQTQESIKNVVTKEWNMYIEAMEAKVEQEQKERQEHIQQVTNQNAMLFTMV